MKGKVEHSQSGFSLIEVFIAISILSIGILSVCAMQTSAITGNSKANTISQATNWATDQIELLMELSYDDTKLDDTDGDGTDEDSDQDGIDDDGDNFGLDNIAGADHSIDPTPDGNYEVYWNVAVDYPGPNMKTVRVHVVNKAGGIRNITLTGIRAKL